MTSFFVIWIMQTPYQPATTNLIALLNSMYPLSEPVVKFINDNTFVRRYDKGELLLTAGNVCKYLYFINKGLLRGFIKDNGRDITPWITSENEVATSIYSLDNESPALENIEAIEPCELVLMTTADLQKLYDNYPEFNIVGRKLLQNYYKSAETRAFIVRVSKAEDKYEHFLNIYSHLANRVLLKHMASFLGMTIETLSRVRSRYTTKKPEYLGS